MVKFEFIRPNKSVSTIPLKTFVIENKLKKVIDFLRQFCARHWTCMAVAPQVCVGYLWRVVVGGPVGAHELPQLDERRRHVGVEHLARRHVHLHARQRQRARQCVLPNSLEPAGKRLIIILVLTDFSHGGFS